MFKVVSGNLLEADAEALVNTVNTVGVMGKGIALQFKKAFPEMAKDYERVCRSGELQPGRMHVYDRGVMFNPRYIINFPTKRHWKGKSKLADIRAGLDALVSELDSRHIRSVAIPPLGCGHGGLQWSEVSPLISAALARLPQVDALVYAPTGAPEPAAMLHRTPRPEMTPRRANVVRVLAEYSVLGYELTLLEIQKLLYFLQVAGEPLQLRFEQGRYGPYADNLRHVLHQFEGHFLEGFGDGRNNPKTPIRLFDDATADAIRIGRETSLPDQEARVERVFRLIEGFESPYGMELLASVHWAASQPTDAPELHVVVEFIHGWNDRKRRLMKPDHIRVAWERLSGEGWIAREAN
ncbi:MAG TPA: macro domain-containing protein [Pirellulales bacterium]|nr:macro domain-containing protein [Pirellulales bacterium]